MLLSGDHGAVARWRRDRALLRTAENRPDLVKRLLGADPAEAGGALSARDREVLAEAGFPVSGQDMAH